MTGRRPRTRLGARYGDATATAAPRPAAEVPLRQAELFWISAVRPDGRPHVTPRPALRWGGAPHSRTGPKERGARGLGENARVVPTTKPS